MAINRCMPSKLSQEEFISRCVETHTLIYDYSATVYEGALCLIVIGCVEHGPFHQRASVHMSGGGCPECARAARKDTLDTFITKAHKQHRFAYDYTNTLLGDFIVVRCHRHGDFRVSARGHKEGVGCPKCRQHVMCLGSTLIG